MAEHHQPDAERIIGVERIEPVLDRRPVFDRDEAGDFILAESAPHPRGERGQEDIAVDFVHAAHQRDLLERECRRILFSRRHEGRPELRGDAALAQARNVGVAGIATLVEPEGRNVALRLRIGADNDRQVVVPVDQRRRFEEADGVGEGGIGRRRTVLRMHCGRFRPREEGGAVASHARRAGKAIRLPAGHYLPAASWQIADREDANDRREHHAAGEAHGHPAAGADAGPGRGRNGSPRGSCTTNSILHGGAFMAFADTVGAVATVLNLPKGRHDDGREQDQLPVRHQGRRGGAAECTPVHKADDAGLDHADSQAGWQLAAIVTQTQLVLPPKN